MNGSTAKRFWSDVSVHETSDGFVVRLDGRDIRTPARAPLVLPTRALAEAMAQEWQAQGDRIDPQTMPITRTANSAIDKVASQRDEVVEIIAAYGDADLLCYRATTPEGLVRRQCAAWDPLLDWAAATFEARLVPRAGVIHQPQDPEALRRLEAAMEDLSDIQLAAFHDLVSLSGSLVIGLAALHSVGEVDDLWTTSRVDEDWQEQQWGQDEEAAALARQKQSAFSTAAELLKLSAN